MVELTIDDALHLGLEAHKAGRYQDADRYFTIILRSFPEHSEANHSMGLIAIELGHIDKSIPFFKKAIKNRKSDLKFWASLADAYIMLEKYDDAKLTLRLAEENGLGGSVIDTISEKLSNLDQKFLKNLTTEQIQAILSLYNQKDYTGVLEKASILLRIYAKSVFLHYICGASNAALGYYEAAIENYYAAIELNPNYADAYNNLGIANQRLGNFKDAVSSYEKAIEKKTDFAQAYNNLGALLLEQKDYFRAVSVLTQAIEKKPDFTEAYINLGIAHKRKFELDDAILCHQKALELSPNSIKALHNLGKSYSAIGNFKQAITCYDKALKINPDFISAVFDNALSCLKAGDYSKGWKLWKRRFLTDALILETRKFRNAKLWNGEKNIKSILLWREQGLGDEMTFANYFHLIEAQNRVIEVSPRLESIFKRSFPNDIVRSQSFDPETRYSPKEDYQYHMPFGEVGPIFDIGKKVDPKAYLVPDPKLATEWSKIRRNKKLTIGLSWRSGNMAEARLKHYTFLEEWLRLVNFEKVRIICTQYGNIDDDIKSLEPDVRKRLYIPNIDMKNDIDGLAAILVNCDLVIGPTSATTMLAGSLGRRTICFAHRDNHFVSGKVKLGAKGKHPWLENGEVHIFDHDNQKMIVNNIIDEILHSENE